jgi:hypothetical protein
MMFKLHLKRCILCLLVGCVLGGVGGWQGRKNVESNILLKYTVGKL